MSSDQRTQVEWFVKAIAAVLSENSMSGFSKITVDLADDAGNSYKLTRTPERLIYLKDGNNIEKENLLIELRDGLDPLDGPSEDFSGLFQSFKVKKEKGKYIARREIRDDSSARQMREIGTELRRLTQQFNKEIGVNFTPSIISRMEKKLKDLLPRIHQVRDMIESKQATESIKEEDHSLKVNVLKDMQNQLADLDGNGLPINELLARRKNLESKLIDLQKKHLHLSEATADINWPEGFQILGRIQVAKRVVKILADKRQEFVEHLQKSFGDRPSSWQNLKDFDLELFKKMALNLDALHQDQNILTKLDDRKKNLTWFDKFKVQDQGKDAESADNNAQQSIDQINDQVQSFMDFFSKIQSQGQLIENTIFRFEDNMEALYEAYLSRLEQLQEEWSKFCVNSNIPSDLNIETVPQLIHASTEVKMINFEIDTLDRLLILKKKASHRLSELIQDWRKMTQSQKQIVSTTLPMMISEAQGYMRYLAMYEKQAEEKQIKIDQEKIHTSQISDLKATLANLENEWDECFTKMSLRPIKPEDVSSSLEMATVIAYFAKKYDQLQAESAIEPFAFHGSFFNVWTIEDIDQSEDQLSSLFEKTSTNCCHLIVVPNEQTALQLYSFGAGKILEIPPSGEFAHPDVGRSPTLAKNNLTPQPEKTTLDLGLTPPRPKSLASEQLMKTLEMLQGKRR